jgi:hypothetical protein
MSRLAISRYKAQPITVFAPLVTVIGRASRRRNRMSSSGKVAARDPSTNPTGHLEPFPKDLPEGVTFPPLLDSNPQTAMQASSRAWNLRNYQVIKNTIPQCVMDPLPVHSASKGISHRHRKGNVPLTRLQPVCFTSQGFTCNGPSRTGFQRGFTPFPGLSLKIRPLRRPKAQRLRPTYTCSPRRLFWSANQESVTRSTPPRRQVRTSLHAPELTHSLLDSSRWRSYDRPPEVSHHGERLVLPSRTESPCIIERACPLKNTSGYLAESDSRGLDPFVSFSGLRPRRPMGGKPVAAGKPTHALLLDDTTDTDLSAGNSSKTAEGTTHYTLDRTDAGSID